MKERWIVEMYEPEKEYNKFIFEFLSLDAVRDFIGIASNQNMQELNFTVYKEKESEDKKNEFV